MHLKMGWKLTREKLLRHWHLLRKLRRINRLGRKDRLALLIWVLLRPRLIFDRAAIRSTINVRTYWIYKNIWILRVFFHPWNLVQTIRFRLNLIIGEDLNFWFVMTRTSLKVHFSHLENIQYFLLLLGQVTLFLGHRNFALHLNRKRFPLVLRMRFHQYHFLPIVYVLPGQLRAWLNRYDVACFRICRFFNCFWLR